MTTYDAALHAAARTEARSHRWRRWGAWQTGLVLLAAGAAFLTAWAVWTAQPSEYYASIALSMSKSWSNFFFGTVDPAGTVTLDKIPGSFWIPALFVKVFGYSPWAVVLPNAFAAVGAAVLVAITAKRMLGPAAGLLAGAVVASTPILVAVARSNQPETFFVLGLAATAWASMHALRRRSFGWLMVAGLFIALSFQTYMLEAWAVWPALAAAWLCTRGAFLGKLWRLAVAGVVSLAASVVWIVIVSLIPAESRPYIGSTLGNSAWEMVFGYNGLGRFGSTTADSEAYRSFTPPFSGSPSVLRLLNEQLAGQIGWLLPAALLAVVVLWVLRFSRAVTVLVTVWLLTFMAMFSIVAGMHQFYTAALAVPVALAVALAFGHARRMGAVWPQVALVAVAAATAVGIGLSVGGYSVPVAVAQAVVAVIVIALLIAPPSSERARRMLRVPLVALAGVAMLLTPLAWSIVTIGHPSSINPVAGGVSEMGGTGGGFAGAIAGRGGSMDGSAARRGAGAPAGGMTGGAPGGMTGGGAGAASGSGSSRNTELIAYLQQNAGGDRYLAATFGAQSAASLILASDGGSFLPIGGFNGADPVPTLAAFEQLVADGELHYVILGSEGGFGGGAGGFGGGSGSTAAGGSGGTGSGAAGGSGAASGTGSAASETSESAQIRSWVQANCTAPADSPSTSLYLCQ